LKCNSCNDKIEGYKIGKAEKCKDTEDKILYSIPYVLTYGINLDISEEEIEKCKELIITFLRDTKELSSEVKE
jgi:hypothetical protein